jgi:pimeloyl-ACP methyl ester carboxylesterase
VRSGSVDLAVRHAGDAGPSVVLVHGLGDNQRSWDRVIQHVAGRFRLITFDDLCRLGGNAGRCSACVAQHPMLLTPLRKLRTLSACWR